MNIKEKLILQIETSYKEFESISKELENFPNKDIPKSEQLEWGTKAKKIQESFLKLNTTLELYLDNFDVLDLPQSIQEYINLKTNVVKQLETPDNETFKEFKDKIDNLKKTIKNEYNI